MKPKVCILRTDGTNCDEELFYAFQKYRSTPEFIHINQLRNKDKKLKDFQILALPGGFAYGDDIISGKVLAVELISFLKTQLEEFIEKDGMILGVCNGFQALIRTGLLPFRSLGKMDATLAQNESSRFECRWVKIKIENSKAKFLKPFEDQILDIAVNHGEGRFLANPKVIERIEKDNLVFSRYVNKNGRPTQKYPDNPNGSIGAIAGVTDPTGKILGLMPHPEKFVDLTQHPNWRRNKNLKPQGDFIFKGMINYVKQS